MVRGDTSRQVAAEFHVAPSTVRSAMSDIRAKLNLVGRGDAAVIAVILNNHWASPQAVFGTELYSSWLAATKSDMDWRPSAVQRVYLNAFTRLLYRRDSESVIAADLAFGLMCWQAGRPFPPPRTDTGPDELDDMLLGIARGLQRPIPPE